MFIKKLKENGWLKTPRIIEAFEKIKREDFLPEETKKFAGIDEALPIGWGQTNSQPLVVAFMLELLEPSFGEKILDVGSGSGWTTALLADIVSNQKFADIENSANKFLGKVIGLEINPHLVEFSKKNIRKYGFIKNNVAEIREGDGWKGLAGEAPFDKILVSAEADKLPEELGNQLRMGGKIVIPINSSIWLFYKKANSLLEGKEYPGFSFVPLVKN